ncbi:hypothetical protein BJY00DRAFT_115967 [Aspergillus carlsbadensis]|nr:hypothetical protein BJY00DRAFT_115967 [Aspergillus carlsbadensis]
MDDCSASDTMCERCYDIFDKVKSTVRLNDLKINPGVDPIIFISTFPDSTDLVFAENLANTVYRTLRTVYELDTKVWKSIIKDSVKGTFTLSVLIDFQKLVEIDPDVVDTVFGQFSLRMGHWEKTRTMVGEHGMHASLARLMFFENIHVAKQARTLVSEERYLS